MLTVHRTAPRRRRHLLSLGVLVGAGALVTAAAFTTLQSVDVRLGAAPTFALQVAGSSTSGWQPSPADWLPAAGASYTISSDEILLSPGESATQRVAVRNDSPSLDADVVVRLASQPGVGRDLFDVLQFTVAQPDGSVLVENVPGPRLAELAIDLGSPLAVGEHSVLDVTYTLPVDADRAYEGSTTAIRVGFEGENT